MRRNMWNKIIQMYEIDKALDQLHTGTSGGTTDLPPELLKNLGSTSRAAARKGGGETLS